MSYTFYSFRNREEKDLEMWSNRTLEGETKSCETRTLCSVFNQYIPRGSKIIEAGCGMGGWVNYFRQKGYDIIGIEYDERVIKKALDFDSHIPIQYGDVNHLHFPNDTFNSYISLGVIEHFQEGPQKALLEARRILKKNGLIFVTVPYLNLFRKLITHPLRDLYFFIRRLMGGNDYFWEYRYTKNEMLTFISETGFKLIYIGIDDYIENDKKHHIGLYGDYFFLREKHGDIWELNKIGKIILRIGRLFSPWLFCSGIHIVAQNET